MISFFMASVAFSDSRLPSSNWRLKWLAFVPRAEKRTSEALHTASTAVSVCRLPHLAHLRGFTPEDVFDVARVLQAMGRFATGVKLTSEAL